METKFNFKSSICTSLEQSERLLTLGLKKETADCVLPKKANIPPLVMPYDKASIYTTIEIIPAWSLHRLILLLDTIACDWIFRNGDCYTNAINGIEWLIKEGYFNKEYLV